MLTQCIAACLTSEATKIVRVLLLYGKMLGDWCVSVCTMCIQYLQLNVISSIFERLGEIFTTVVSPGALTVLVYTPNLET